MRKGINVLNRTKVVFSRFKALDAFDKSDQAGGERVTRNFSGSQLKAVENYSRLFVLCLVPVGVDVMKKMTTLLLMAVAAMAFSVRSAKAEGIPKSMLAQMGLAGMQEMSDQEGQQVRGEGIASVFGIGYATVGLAGRLDMHSATSNRNNAAAGGRSHSKASKTVRIRRGRHRSSFSVKAQSSGGGFAFAR